MTKNFLIYFLIILLFMVSCGSKSKKRFIKTYYPSGKLLRHGWYKNDTIPIDTIFEYYENGKLSSVTIYDTGGKLNGPFITYYENGNKQQINSYAHGQLQEFTYLFNKFGKLESKIFSLNGKQIGDFYGYYPNGNLHNYAFYWDDTTYVNYIEYDSLEKINPKLNNRPILFNNITTVSNLTIKDQIQKDIKIELIISNPPHSRTKINIGFISEKGLVIKEDSVVNKPYYFSHIVLPDSLKSINFSAIQYDSTINKYYYYNIVTRL